MAIPTSAETNVGAGDPGRSIRILNLNTNMEVVATLPMTNLVSNNVWSDPYGLEFDASGRYLYFTHSQTTAWPRPLDVWDVQTSAIVTPTLNSTFNPYRNSFIERFGNDLYLAKSTHLGRIANASNPPTAVWNHELVTIASGYGNQGNAGSFNLRYILPDQVDDDPSYGAFESFSCACCEAYSSGSISSYIATQNATWTPGFNPLNGGTGPVAVINDELRIAPGTQITIEGMELRFKPNAKVVVMRGNGASTGATLVLSQQSKFTADADCSSREYGVCNGVDQGCNFGYWQGVIVEGHDNLGQNSSGTSQQASFVMIQQSTIEYAITAVRAGHPDLSNYGGGIISIVNSNIKDNVQGVVFDPYIRLNAQQVEQWTVSTMRNSRFVTTSDFISGSLPGRFVTINTSSGVRITGCVFENEVPGAFSFFNAGIGVYVSNSRASISWHCQGGLLGDCSDGTVLQSEFRNLFMGVYGINSAQNTRKLTVGYSKFDKNIYGITLNNFINPEILDNTFIVPRTPGVFWQPYGAALTASTGYDIENNEFSFATGTGFPTSNGLIIIDSGTTFNRVYRNHFTDLETATTAQGTNGIPNSPTGDPNPVPTNGLVYRCNQFDAPVRNSDIFVSSGAINPNQGFCNTNLDDPAGNMFSHSSTTYSNHMDFRLNVPSVNQFLEVTYRHHALPPQRLRPLAYTTTSIPLVNPVECVAIPYSKEEACRVNKSGAPVIRLFGDGKSDDALASDQEETPWSADEIFAEAAEWQALVEEASASGVQDDDDALAGLMIQKSEFWKKVVDYHQTDTLGHLTNAQMAALLDTYTPQEAGRYASSLAALSGMDTPSWVDADNNMLVATESFAVTGFAEGDELPTEQVELFESGFFAQHGNAASLNAAYVEAGAWYLLHVIHNDVEATDADDAKSGVTAADGAQDEWARVYPNPFNAQITIALHQDAMDGQATVTFFDLAGRKVLQRQFPQGQPTLVLDGTALPKGVLLYELTTGNGLVQRGKLVRVD